LNIVKYLNNIGLNSNDINQLEDQGISLKSLNMQVDSFRNGIPSLLIDRPASPGDGIRQLAASELDRFEKAYTGSIAGLDLCKFVPASGAASRMFKDLLSFLNQPDVREVQVEKFFIDLHKFAFYKQLCKRVEESGDSVTSMTKNRKYRELLDILLTASGMNYQDLPKALLKFHQYPNGSRTALEEHLVEAALYARSRGRARIHFTTSTFHYKPIKDFLDQVIPKYQRRFELKYQISLSVQHPSTDTIAVYPNNLPFRDNKGKVLVRPGGHGALLQNLNNVTADVIFIKNIDNVAPDNLKPLMVRYKKALVGVLLENQARIFKYLNQMDSLSLPSNLIAVEISDYLKNSLGRLLGDDYDNLVLEERMKYLHDSLNRPLRVCSVIRTEKVTGGGPYWVSSPNGDQSLQIIENAQLDSSDNLQSATVSQYAHITDLVCAVKNYKGEKFDLQKYIDPDTGFITEKNYLGERIRVLEHPGLWNGSMAHWNTILVEVPNAIFHPVKSIWDLLTSDHQSI